MNATLDYVVNFKENIDKATSKDLGEPAEIIETIKKVKAVNPPCYEADRVAAFLSERTSALTSLIDSYFVSVFSRNYPMLDEGIFKLRRYLHWNGNTVIND